MSIANMSTYRAMVEALGPDATASQVSRVVDWMRENIGDDYIRLCEDIAIESDCGDLFSAISEYRCECGIW